MKLDESSPARSTAYRAALLIAFSGVPIAPALAADLTSLEGWRALLPTHAGWALLGGLGLMAIAVAAVTLGRARRERPPEDAPLGRMREDSVPRSPASSGTDVQFDILARALDSAPDRVAAGTGDAPRPAASAIPAPPSAPANGSQLFLALHHVDLSIDVLRRHLRRQVRPMPAVWLMLLDLSRTHGREQTFRELALEFHQRFNVCAPAWDGFPPGRDDPGLEAYPRLVKEITLAWGTPECPRLLDRLLYNNRSSERKGFTLNAYNDLIALRRAADAVLQLIDEDLAEEAKVRSAFASASADIDAELAVSAARETTSPLVSDLESQLDDDLRASASPKSAVEREHPALAGMLAREWGNAAMSARLCEMLARSGADEPTLSKKASEEIELLREMAERLRATNGIAASTGKPADATTSESLVNRPEPPSPDAPVASPSPPPWDRA